MLYLDCAASAPLHPEVLKELNRAMAEDFANPDARHRAGRKVARTVEDVRQELSHLIGAKPGDTWLFTSGATESNNTLIKGLDLRPGEEILLNRSDHPSLVAPALEWEQKGIRIRPAGKAGRKCRLALLSFVHPLSAKVENIEELARQIKDENPRAFVHVDAAQGFGKLPLKVHDAAIDSIAVSAHKLGGPKGIGGLFLKERLLSTLRPLLTGGRQQGGLRSSTVPAPLISAFGCAVRIAHQNLQANLQAAQAARTGLRRQLAGAIPVLRFPFEEEASSPYIFSFVHPHIPAEVLLRHLESEGIMASTGPACSGGKRGPDAAALSELGLPPVWHHHVLRVSFYPSLQDTDANHLVRALQEADVQWGGIRG